MNLENFVLATEKDSLESENKIIPIPDYGTKVTGDWLEDSLPLDAALIKAEPEIMDIIEKLFPEILDQIELSERIKKVKTAKNLSRIKYTCKVILFNLYIAYLMDKPIRYSRSKDYYNRASRYGQLFFKYNRVITVVDTFKKLDLIHRKGWINDRKNGFRRQSRMWASEKLILMFNETTLNQTRQVYADEPSERIVLRNAMKYLVDYTDTDQTHSFRRNLDYYNNFITGQEIEVQSDETQQISLYNLRSNLYRNILKGDATLKHLQSDIKSTHQDKVCDSNIVHNNSSVENSNIRREYNINNKNIKHNNTSMTRSFFQLTDSSDTSQVTEQYQPQDWFFTRTERETPYGNIETPENLSMDTMIRDKTEPLETHIETDNQLSLFSTIIKQKMLAHKNDKQFMNEKMALKDFDIGKLNFVINNKKLHRVFNQRSFELGGRFYGAFYQGMPKEFRKDILINGEHTVELDYAAHHMRMSYNREKIDYREDPYLALTDDEKERKTFKNLLLIAINAETVAKAIKGFRKACVAIPKEDRIELTNANILKLMARIYKAHKPIAHYISSGAGLRLQNIDSQITEAILMRMTRQAIPCLPVHDSYIVSVRHREVLYQAMIEEYEKVMGFTPVVK